MSMRGRLLLAVALAAIFAFASVYYGRQDGGRPPTLQRADAPVAEQEALPAHEGLSTDRPPEARFESAVPEPAQLVDLDERIRSFTTPTERAVAGLDDVPLKIPMGPIPEFKETLRQF